MEQLYLKARAKVNLTLAVLGKKDDGYHNLDSIFQKINLYDEMWIEKIEEDKFILNSNIENVKMQDNIIYKAYYKLKQEKPKLGGVKVILKKNIPMQAGLAGGSTDCASFLITVNKLYNLKIKPKRLKEIAKSLGADVVPCMYNGAVLAKGIGENVKKINTHFKYYFVIVKPNFFCSTKEMYNKLDAKEIFQTPKSDEVIKALEKNGAKALLAGSGSCVFGIFKEKQEAKNAYNNLKKFYKTYICTSYNLRRNSFE